MATLDLRLKRVNKTYHEGDLVAGVVIVQSKGDLQHQGIILTMEGAVNLQLSSKSVGVFEAFYNSLKPMQLLSYTLEVAKPGRLPSGKTEIPFELPLKPKVNKSLYETYHGVFVNVQYSLKVDMKRSLLNKDLQKQSEFIVEYKNDKEKSKVTPVNFTISPETLTNVKEDSLTELPALKQNVPKFKVQGKLNSSSLKVTDPLVGELMVEFCEAPIKSIEIQLVRVETCGCAEGYAKDEFEVNIVLVFQDDHLVTENFPIKLSRS